MKIADLLDLLRIPNVFTAMSDVVAATAVVAGTTDLPTRWVPAALAVGASAALYGAGMALNDLADAETDALERPGRPIPSGRARRGEAAGITIFLVLLGLALAWAAGTATLVIASLLVGAIVLYDLGLAGRSVAGPAGMATCRALNLLMGLAAAGAVPLWGILAIATWFVYVFGLTHLSLGEVAGGGRVAVAVAALSALASALAIVGLSHAAHPDRSVLSWLALAISLGLFLSRSGAALARAWADPIAARVGPAVGALVSGILWLGAALATALAPAAWLLPFLVLAVGQESLRRSFRVT